MRVLSEEKRQQVLALGRLRWPLRRIEEATGVRRETASKYLKAAGIVVRRPRGRVLDPQPVGEPPPKAASQALTDLPPKAASQTPADPWPPRPTDNPRLSAYEEHRELVEARLKLGRSATMIWQEPSSSTGTAAPTRACSASSSCAASPAAKRIP